MIIACLFSACSESTEPASEENIENTKQALAEIDQTFGIMMSTPMFSMLETMPDLTGILGTPNLMNSGLANRLLKVEIINKLVISEDDNPFLFLLIFSQITGTFVYENEVWVHSDEPANELIIEYDFLDQTDGSSKKAKIRVFDFTVTNTLVDASVEIFVDDVRTVWANLSIVGSDLLSMVNDPVITTVSADGGVVVGGLGTMVFDASLTDTLISLTFGLSGGSSTITTIEGSELLSASMTSMEDSALPITKITIKRNSLTLVIDNFMAESGDIGDILYDNIKVADLIVENEQLNIVFVNGDENTINELLPVMFSFLEGA